MDSQEDRGNISDGYHTFNELYAHRFALWIALCKATMQDPERQHSVWRSHHHSDGSRFDGWFILGMGTEPGEQITYHVPDSEWPSCDFAKTRGLAPAFDGHTSADVIERIRAL